MHSLNSRNVSFILGSAFVLVALLGFIPNPLISPTGLFEVNVHHNIVHLLTGLLILSGPLLMRGREHVMLLVAGALYGLIALAGLIAGPGMLFGMIAINNADNALHIFLAAVLIGAGLATRKRPLLRRLG